MRIFLFGILSGGDITFRDKYMDTRSASGPFRLIHFHVNLSPLTPVGAGLSVKEDSRLCDFSALKQWL